MSSGFHYKVTANKPEWDCEGKPAWPHQATQRSQSKHVRGAAAGTKVLLLVLLSSKLEKYIPDRECKQQRIQRAFQLPKKPQTNNHPMVLFFPEVGILHVVLSVLKKSHTAIYLPCDFDLILPAQKESITLH